MKYKKTELLFHLDGFNCYIPFHPKRPPSSFMLSLSKLFSRCVVNNNIFLGSYILFFSWSDYFLVSHFLGVIYFDKCVNNIISSLASKKNKKKQSNGK